MINTIDKIVDDAIKKYCGKKLSLTQPYLIEICTNYNNDPAKYNVEMTDAVLHIVWKLVVWKKYSMSKADKYDICLETYAYVMKKISTIPLDGSVVVFRWLSQLAITGIEMAWNRNHKKKLDVVSYSEWADANL